MMQVAEERALGGMCSHAACAQLLNATTPKGTFKVDSRRQRVYKEGDVHFCRQAMAHVCKVLVNASSS